MPSRGGKVVWLRRRSLAAESRGRVMPGIANKFRHSDDRLDVGDDFLRSSSSPPNRTTSKPAPPPPNPQLTHLFHQQLHSHLKVILRMTSFFLRARRDLTWNGRFLLNDQSARETSQVAIHVYAIDASKSRQSSNALVSSTSFADSQLCEVARTCNIIIVDLLL